MKKVDEVAYELMVADGKISHPLPNFTCIHLALPGVVDKEAEEYRERAKKLIKEE